MIPVGPPVSMSPETGGPTGMSHSYCFFWSSSPFQVIFPFDFQYQDTLVSISDEIHVIPVGPPVSLSPETGGPTGITWFPPETH